MKLPTTALALRDIDLVFRPFRHRKLNLPTRLVMVSRPCSLVKTGVPVPEMGRYYTRRAVHELGLILTEPVAVDAPAAASGEDMPSFFGGHALRVWKGICRSVHLTGCKIAPVLCHAGMLNPGAAALGPSGLDPVNLKHRGESLTRQGINEVAQAFGQAAAYARVLRFDAVAIEGDAACLIEQFLRPETNHRHDEYGGDIVARSRFACEVVHAVRKSVGRLFPVIFRLPEHCASTPAELESLVNCLCDAGVDIFACTTGDVHLPAFTGNPLNLAAWVRMLSRRPVIAEGGVGLRHDSLKHLAHSMLAQEFDLVAVGRALMADAEWGRKVRFANEEAIRPFPAGVWPQFL